MIRALWKPWYVHRPGQIFKRIVRSSRPLPAKAIVRMPWGVRLEIDPRENIGREVWTVGVFDLVVSELLYRLVPVGGTALDVGANIGHMTSVLAAKVGRTGRVLAFEPHPVVADRLAHNVEFAKQDTGATVELHRTALSDANGTAELIVPKTADANEGLATLSPGSGTVAAGIFTVPTARLDDLPNLDRIDVIKMDVEGHEAAVLRGATRLLNAAAIAAIVFEEHEGPTSATCHILQAAGYTLFQTGWHINGLVLAGLDEPNPTRNYMAPSFLALKDPAAALHGLKTPGWQVFSSRGRISTGASSS